MEVFFEFGAVKDTVRSRLGVVDDELVLCGFEGGGSLGLDVHNTEFEAERRRKSEKREETVSNGISLLRRALSKAINRDTDHFVGLEEGTTKKS